MEKTDRFTSEPIWKLIAKMCIPAIVTTLVVVLYNMADIFFISKTGDTAQVAAISLISPIFAILSGLGALIGSGGCAALSIVLGRRDEEQARKISSFCCYFSLGASLLFSIVVLCAMTPVMSFIQASPETEGYARTYLTWICVGAPFIVFSSAFANIVRAEGAVKESMIGNGIGSILNIILDPILILGFNMGVAGAAIATVIGNMASVVYIVLYIRSKKSRLSIHPRQFTFSRNISLKVISLGMPTAIGILLMSISNLITNTFVSGYGDSALAARGVAGSIGMIISMVQMGICMGIQPAIAYNFGAENLKRVIAIVKRTALLTVTVGSALSVICWFARTGFMASFINDAEVIGFGQQMVMGSIVSGPVFGLFYLATGILQSIDKASYATLTSLLRQGIILIPILLLLNAIAGLSGVIFAQAVADVVATVIGVGLCFTQYTRITRVNEIEKHLQPATVVNTTA